MGFGRSGGHNLLRRKLNCLNALTGIDGIWTRPRAPSQRGRSRLNALTGIDGIWT